MHSHGGEPAQFSTVMDGVFNADVTMPEEREWILRLINSEEAELVRMINLSMKMSSQATILDYFRLEHENNVDDSDSAFSYGVCCFALYLNPETDRVEKHKHLQTGISVFSECLRIQEDWWLARYFRSEATQELPDGLRQMSTDLGSLRYEFVEPNEDRQILIEQQKKVEAEPYFLSPYVSMVKSYIYQGKVEEAFYCLNEGLNSIPLKPVQFDISTLSHAYLDVVLLLRWLNVPDKAEEIKSVALKLFPQNTALMMA